MDAADLKNTASHGSAPAAAALRQPRHGLLAPDDLSAVAWVHTELKRSLEATSKTLRRYLRDADSARQSDLDTVEPAVLRGARAQLHQGVGALELVDMPAAAQVLRAAESLVQRMIAKPTAATAAAVEAVERVCFALLDYLGRHLAGKPVSPVALFPQYEKALLLAGAERVHPADLWHYDIGAWLERLRSGAGPTPLPADVPRRADDAARSEMESLVLGLMREPGRNTCLRMSKLCADLSAGATQQTGEQGLAGLWQSAAAVYEALANGLLANDGHTKRVASRLLAQLRASARGQLGLSDRLAQDLIFFCVHAAKPAAERPSPRLAAVRKAWRLEGLLTHDYGRVRLGLFDPALLASAKRRVAAAKDTWAAVAGDEQHRLSNLMEQFALVGESLQKLFPLGDTLAHALSLAAAQTAATLAAPPPALAMEVATAFLYIDAALEDGELDQVDLPDRVQQLAQRVDQVRAGAAQQPLEAWMEELYRRVSHRQTMGSVVQELRVSLSEVEKEIDQFFRQPADTAPIVAVPGQLSAMRGVLSVLGMDHASQAVLHMRDDVEALLHADFSTQSAQQLQRSTTFNRLADNLGALSFLIDMLSVQPQLAKTLFSFDASTGNLSATMGLRERVSVFDALDAQPASVTTAGGNITELPAGLPELAEQALPPTADRAAGPPTAEKVAAPPTADRAAAPPTADRTAAPPTADRTAARPVSSAAPMAPSGQAVDGKLLVRLQALAAEAAQPNLGDDELLPSIELVAQQAVAADRADLVRLLNHAQRGLRDSTDPASSRAIRTALVRAVADVTMPAAPLPMPADRPVPAPKPTPVGGTGLEDDAELRDIFIEEAREVTEQALQALPQAPGAGGDAAADMTTIRRAFHTLKGSARMVGLRDFGEAAWACEQLYNVRIALSPVPDDALVQLTRQALAYLRGWTDAIDAGADHGHHAAAVVQAADALRLRSELRVVQPVLAPAVVAAGAAAGALAAVSAATLVAAVPRAVPALPEGQPAPNAANSLAARVSNLPTAADLELRRPEAASAPAPPVTEVDFELDLDGAGSDFGAPALPAGAPALPHGGAAWSAPTAPALFSLSPTAAPTAAPTPAPTAAPTPAPTPAPVQAAAHPSAPAPSEAAVPLLEFEFDLGPGDSAAAPATAVVDPSAAPVATMPAGDVLELDLADFSEFMPAAPAAPATSAGHAAPVLAVPHVLQELQEPQELQDLQAPPVPDAPAVPAAPDDEENYKRIGPLRISIPLFNIFLNEADELSRRLVNELAEWALESDTRAVPESCAALAHGLAGSAGTVGCADLSALARALEHALMRSHAAGAGRLGESDLFSATGEEIRRLLHQFAAGFLRDVPAVLRERLAEHERLPAPLHVTENGAFAVDDEPPLHAAARDGLQALAAATSLATPPASLRTVGPASLQPALVPTGAHKDAFDDDQDIDIEDSLDAELFPIFDEEADELLPQLQARLRDWMHLPDNEDPPAACMRTLHTFKGGARLAGAMRLGEMAHRLETAIEHLAASETVRAADVLPLLGRADSMVAALEQLRRPAAPLDSRAAPLVTLAPLVTPAPATVLPLDAPTVAPVPTAAADAATAAATATATATAATAAAATASAAATAIQSLLLAPAQTSAPAAASAAAVSEAAPPAPEAPSAEHVSAPLLEATAAAAVPTPGAVRLDWSRFDRGAVAPATGDETTAKGPAGVRVRAALLDRLLNQAGEVTIARSRIDADVKSLQSGVGELGESLDRMRRQLRDIEVQAETQISSRLEAAKAAAQSFDPLEMDRFTRLQELTRFMAESVNDVATLQRGLLRTLQSTEDQLAAQSRLTRDLQDDLLRTRMVEFESAADRLYRTVRQAAKELGKQVRLDILGGAIELDRGVLERMIGPFEHLLRNCVAHGVEAEAERLAAGKGAIGQVTIAVAQSGNEVAVDIADDGAGLDLQRIRQRAIERRLLPSDAAPTEAELSQLIFKPGFTTANVVTELAGRGVGLDVVRAEVTAMGGRIETQTSAGKGTRFKLLLPLTTAVTQVVMLRCEGLMLAVPSTLIESIRRVPAAEVQAAYASSSLTVDGEALPFYWLAALLQAGTQGHTADGRSQAVAVVRSAAQRVAVHIEEVVGNQEVVVKNVGPQLARVPGLAGVTLLPSGAVALIYNPVALAAVYGEQVRKAQAEHSVQPPGAGMGGAAPAAPPRRQQPLVMVVDDSLTVRRATERLLVREGYRVVTAKDGLDALEKLAGERPVVLLSDIEMPRMDGFDLLRNVRADAGLADLPVVMITSRIAHKHREHASELGADHYLGKPYGEEELLRLVARYAAGGIRAGVAV